MVSLASYILVYAAFVSFGIYYIYKLLQQGPTVAAKPIPGATGSRPLAYADTLADGYRQWTPNRQVSVMEVSNLALFWAGVLGCAVLLYVILDGFDLGVGILFGTTRDEAKRAQMMGTVAPFWDGNETWLVVIGAGLFAAFPDGLRGVPQRLLFSGAADAVWLDLPRHRL